jgi:hypothetical protein
MTLRIAKLALLVLLLAESFPIPPPLCYPTACASGTNS